MKIGLFGGTFDPPHVGHIQLAQDLKDKASLDAIWVIPAHHSPLRQVPGTPAYHRLAMARLAFNPLPGFSVLSLEIDRPPPSYTIDTICALQEAYPQEDFYLLVGEDVLKGFLQWKEPEKILRKIPLLIGSRPVSFCSPSAPPWMEEIFSKSRIPTSLCPVSATYIRERLHQRADCRDLVPAKVLDYIRANQLY